MAENSKIGKFLTGNSSRLLSLGIFLLRGTVGVILFVIGAGKVMGWFGGHGLAPTVQVFVTKLGIPAPLAYLSCFTEFLGGFLLLVGFLTRPAAFAVMINMLVATKVTWPSGFFTGQAAYPFTLMMSAIVILIAGPMAISLDSLLFRPPKSPAVIDKSPV